MRTSIQVSILVLLATSISPTAYSQSTLTPEQLQQIEAYCRDTFRGEEQNIQTCILNRRARAGDQPVQEQLTKRSSEMGAKLLAAEKMRAAVAADDVGEVATQWNVVSKSVTQLLNEGWAITSFSSRDSDWQVGATLTAVVGGAASASAWPRSNRLELLLQKAGKHVYCKIEDPVVSSAVSVCRALN